MRVWERQSLISLRLAIKELALAKEVTFAGEVCVKTYHSLQWFDLVP